MATTLQFGNEDIVAVEREVPAARNMARFFFACFWTVLFSGAVRKWMFPGVTVLYLLQDVPIVLAYLYAFWTGFYRKDYLFLGILFMSVVIAFQTVLQVIGLGLPLFIAAIGIHNYLLYLPMLIIFPICMTEKYRRKFIWWNLMLSLPMCLLVVAQSQSPKGAFINRTSEGAAFGIPGAEIARVSGTFNFVAFYAIWVAMAVALCLGEWLVAKEKRVVKNQWLLIACTGAVNICHLVSGSRLAILFSALALLGAMAAALIMRSTGAIAAVAGIVVLLPIIVAIASVVSPQSFNAIYERFSDQHNIDNSQDRIIYGMIAFAVVPKFSLIGIGTGAGVDAANVGSTVTGDIAIQISENDLSRNVSELGTPVGLFYVLSRIMFIVVAMMIAVRIVRSGGTPHVLPLSFVLFAQSYLSDWTRSAALSATQVFIGYAFVLGAYYHPDSTGQEDTTNDLYLRSE